MEARQTSKAETCLKIQYVKGDATQPLGTDPRIIVHIVDDTGGAWRKGFVSSLSRRWKRPETEYLYWFRAKRAGNTPFKLGQVQFVGVESKLWVANLLGQHDIISHRSIPPIRYAALREGIATVGEFAIKNKASVHLPKIGTGLAGGDWTTIRQIIEEELVAKGIAVTVYLLQ